MIKWCHIDWIFELSELYIEAHVIDDRLLKRGAFHYTAANAHNESINSKHWHGHLHEKWLALSFGGFVQLHSPPLNNIAHMPFCFVHTAATKTVRFQHKFVKKLFIHWWLSIDISIELDSLFFCYVEIMIYSYVHSI